MLVIPADDAPDDLAFSMILVTMPGSVCEVTNGLLKSEFFTAETHSAAKPQPNSKFEIRSTKYCLHPDVKMPLNLSDHFCAYFLTGLTPV